MSESSNQERKPTGGARVYSADTETAAPADDEQLVVTFPGITGPPVEANANPEWDTEEHFEGGGRSGLADFDDLSAKLHEELRSLEQAADPGENQRFPAGEEAHDAAAQPAAEEQITLEQAAQPEDVQEEQAAQPDAPQEEQAAQSEALQDEAQQPDAPQAVPAQP